MTCQECEVLLGNGEDARQHLSSCAECRMLAEDLRLNATALREMRVRPARWPWAAAMVAAAAVVMTIGISRMAPDPKPVFVAEKADRPLRPQAVEKSARVDMKLGQNGLSPFSGRPSSARREARATEPLKVKMLTSDPDVVIYWIVDRKEGTE